MLYIKGKHKNLKILAKKVINICQVNINQNKINTAIFI